jgi:hypothetical protein
MDIDAQKALMVKVSVMAFAVAAACWLLNVAAERFF